MGKDLISCLKIKDGSNILRSDLKKMEFNSNFIFAYRNQYLTAAVFIVDGIIRIRKRDRVYKTFSNGSLVGVRELMNSQKMSYDVEIVGGAKICFIDRNSLISILDTLVIDNSVKHDVIR